MWSIQMADNRTTQPKLTDLYERYLQKQAQAHAEGLTTFDAGEVTPFEAGPVQPVDARLAWQEALAAGPYYAADWDNKRCLVPPAWSQIVAAAEPAVAVPFCLGNFPQLVRNLHLLLHKKDLPSLRPAGGTPIPAPELDHWA